MQLDPDILRDHFASLSDEALRKVKRSELVEGAREYFDAECTQRQLVTGEQPAGSFEPALMPVPEIDPNWIDDAVAVSTYWDAPKTHPSAELLEQSRILEASNIPSTIVQAPSDNGFEFRLLVPAPLIMRATSILDQQIANVEAEAEWEAHLAELSDKQLIQLRPEDVCAGWLDRARRYKKVYEAELARRRSH